MKSIKLALLGGAALAVSAAAAHADDLDALKAQIESLNARVAAMEAAPSVPAGYQLLTISQGEQPTIPGLESLRKDQLAYGKKATIISVLPTADAPAGTEIVWSGYARAAVQYLNVESGYTDRTYTWTRTTTGADLTSRTLVSSEDYDTGFDDLDVFARGQIKVTGKTDTAVGEVGATIEMRGNLDGRRELSGTVADSINDAGSLNGYVYIEQAWGYWAMTPELTLGGGFAKSLGFIGYGYDGACNCYYTDNYGFDVALDPGDTSQMRLSYASGPFSMAVALEDATGRGSMFAGDRSNVDNDNPTNADGSKKIGVAGEVAYKGDTFSGEISGVWRDASDAEIVGGPDNGDNLFEDPWMIGAGVGFGFDMINLSAAAGTGQYNNGQEFWKASILASASLNDEIHAEAAYGYSSNNYDGNAVNAVLAGVYYDPVSQLTIGLEGEWTNTAAADDSTSFSGAACTDTAITGTCTEYVTEYDDQNTFQVDLVTVFRF